MHGTWNALIQARSTQSLEWCNSFVQCTSQAVSAVSVCAYLPRSASDRQGPDVGLVTSRAAEPYECVQLQAVGCHHHHVTHQP